MAARGASAPRPHPTRSGPVAVADRVPLLDAIRGIALGGILLANLMSFFGADLLGADGRRALWAPDAGERVLFAINWLVEGKFYSVFSILLGVGFALQRARALARGVDPRAFGQFFRRRMLALIGIGLVHMYGLWSGDILTLYGLMGLALPWLFTFGRRARVSAMLVLFAVPFVTHLIVWASSGALDPRPPFADLGSAVRVGLGVHDRPAVDAFTGSARDYWSWNTSLAVARPGTYLQSGRPAKVLALFLLGAWLGASALPRLDALRRSLWVTLSLGGAIGLIASYVYAHIKMTTGSTFTASVSGLVQTAAYTLGTTPLALAYLAAATLLWRTAGGRRSLEWFVPLGRMALSVYLTQTLVQMIAFSGVGLGLSGRLPIVWLPLTAAVLLTAQRATCVWWLEHHAQGPVEHLWRRATYGRLAPSSA